MSTTFETKTFDTTKQLDSLKPAATGQRYVRLHTARDGFGVIVNDRGKRTFFLNTRYPGAAQPARRVIGVYADVTNAALDRYTLADARRVADQWRELIVNGVDPQRAAEDENARAETQEGAKFKRVAEDFIASLPATERRRDEVARTIRNRLVPAWGELTINEIDDMKVRNIIVDIAKTGPSYARNIFGYIRRLFSWVIDQRVYGLTKPTDNPCTELRIKSLVGKKLRRKRILKDNELRAVWRAALETPYPYGPLVRLLILTGQRRSEIGDAERDELDAGNRQLVITAERMKADEAHLVPLSTDAMRIVDELPKFSGPFLFSASAGSAPVNSFPAAKERLDRLALKALKDEARAAGQAVGDVKLEPYTLHDLRRTMRTHLSALPIPEHVAERLIAHSQPVLSKTYNLHSFAEEKREAMELWAGRLRSIIEPPVDNNTGPNVVSLKTARRR